ncbi:dynein axonemal heavy chain 12-like [Schistocerca cancellata]|uniref:dynein axonemal heavy chain 12-like n=1 Tax=Schistocerca cancellata TaxID=274614 RepID=UPI002117560B|nr:dynein axonemal heavy chain 12-like [Schistocerca cancellata]
MTKDTFLGFLLLIFIKITIGNFFKGVAVSGAWICLDNYNTIAVEVVSVLAQHTSAVIHALQSNMKAVIFEGLELPLKTTGFLCITVDVQCETCSALPANLRKFMNTVKAFLKSYNVVFFVCLCCELVEWSTEIIIFYECISCKLSGISFMIFAEFISKIRT